jgi:hypothetical protein
MKNITILCQILIYFDPLFISANRFFIRFVNSDLVSDDLMMNAKMVHSFLKRIRFYKTGFPGQFS